MPSSPPRRMPQKIAPSPLWAPAPLPPTPRATTMVMRIWPCVFLFFLVFALGLFGGLWGGERARNKALLLAAQAPQSAANVNAILIPPAPPPAGGGDATSGPDGTKTGGDALAGVASPAAPDQQGQFKMIVSGPSPVETASEDASAEAPGPNVVWSVPGADPRQREFTPPPAAAAEPPLVLYIPVPVPDLVPPGARQQLPAGRPRARSGLNSRAGTPPLETGNIAVGG